MTAEERNALSNRERIKQFLENSIRDYCDLMTDSEFISSDALNRTIERISNLSVVYKNMGFDRDSD